MQTMFNVHEAKADFSNILARVENQLITVTIMRYGKPSVVRSMALRCWHKA